MDDEANIPEIVRCPPVLMIAFSRPNTLKEVFAKVREIKPSQLFLWLNKGRADRPDEVRRNDECRAIFDSVDWPCEVHRMYNEKYLECIDSFQGAYNWLFSQVDRAVILEDDCVPDLTFFRFCGELLEKYKDDTRIGMIAGHDEHLHLDRIDFHGDSYYFDRYATIWGWATWRRAWKLYDPDMKYWPRLRNDFYLLKSVFRDKRYLRRRLRYTDQMYRKEAGEWDGRWVTTMYRENMLCIHPTVNLIANIGVGHSSRVASSSKKHCIRCATRNKWARCPLQLIKFPLVHPVSLIPNFVCEQWVYKDLGFILPWYKHAWMCFKRGIKRMIRSK